MDRARRAVSKTGQIISIGLFLVEILQVKVWWIIAAYACMDFGKVLSLFMLYLVYLLYNMCQVCVKFMFEIMQFKS